MYLGSNLVYLRNSKNMTQSEVAKQINASQQSVASYETEIREPKLKSLIKIARFFEVSVDDLLTQDLSPEGSLLSKNIYWLRKKEGFKQSEIGELLGVGKATICNYERGKTELNYEGLINLSEFFGISVDDLLKKDLSKEI